MKWEEVHTDNIATSMIRFGLPKHLGYLFYSFRLEYKLTEAEMVKLLELTTNSHWFKKEYGIEEVDE